MAINQYDIGDLVRVSVIFKNDALVATDPTTVSLKFRKPDGTVTTWAVTAGEIVKDSTGNYHADIPISASGGWHYKWFGTGAVVVGEESAFVVRPTLIT